MKMDPPNWIRRGVGKAPRAIFGFRAESSITAFAGMRECGDYVVADDLGTLYRLDRMLNVTLLTRLQEPIRLLSWSDLGQAGTAVVGKNKLVRINEKLQVEWTVGVPFDCAGLAIDPFGVFTFVASVDGGAIVLDERGKRNATLETLRPLAYLTFLTEQPLMIGAAEHGSLGAYTVTGQKVWESAIWSNVGDLAVVQSAGQICLAANNHGIRVYNTQGESITSLILEGTVNRLAASYRGNQFLASTVENKLYRINNEGELLWGAEADTSIRQLYSHPLGHSGVVVFEDRTALLLEWS